MNKALIAMLLGAALIAPPASVVRANERTESRQTKKSEEQKAYGKYQAAVQKYGADSKQAVKAKAHYDKVVAAHRGQSQSSRLNQPATSTTR